MSLTQQAVSGVKWNGVSTVARAGLQFVSLAVLARLLAPGDFGLMSMAVVVTGFAQTFADFGLSNAIIHRQDTTREQLSSLYWVNLTVGFIIFALVWLAIPFAVAYYQEERLVPILRWAAGSFLIVPFGQQFQSLLRRELRFRTLSLIQVSQSVIYALSAIGFAWAGFGVMSLVWGTLLQTLAGTALLSGVAIRSHWLPTFHFRRTDLGGFMQFGLFQMGERSLNFLSNNVDYLIIGRFLGSEPLGYYTLAYNLMRLPLTYVNPIVVSVAFPAFARMQHQDGVLRRGYGKILHYLGAVTFPIMAGMMVVAPIFVPLVYGPQWAPAVPVVQIFCLLGALKSLGNPIGSLLLAKGRADWGFWTNAIAVVGYSIMTVIGVRWGINGVAICLTILVGVIMQPIGFYLRWVTIRMTARDYFRAFMQPAIAAMAMLIVVFPLYYLLLPIQHPIASLSVIVLSGVIVYMSMLRLLDRPLLIEVMGYLRPASSPKV